MALADTQIKANSHKDKDGKPKEPPYKLYDEKGLFLQITRGGGKWWRFKYQFNGKEKLLSLRTYPEVTLAQARGKRDEARTLAALGKDPSEDRKESKEQAKLETINTFEAVANEWHALHNKSKSEHHQQRVRRWLDVYPFGTSRPQR